MKIYLKQIRHYFLTVDTNGARKHHMFQEFADFNLTEVTPILNIEKFKSGASGFCRMLDIGLRNQVRNAAFQPFVMYEDDCSKYRDFPDVIEVPDDADILYIGLSKCSMNNTTNHFCNYYTHVNTDVVSIVNMLATHGIIVCSASGALAIQKAVLESFYKNVPWDVYLAFLQPYYKVYALKKPLVYQDSKYGGAEFETRFSIVSDTDSPIPMEYIYGTSDSIMTCMN
jgi:hypothetical protein